MRGDRLTSVADAARAYRVAQCALVAFWVVKDAGGLGHVERPAGFPNLAATIDQWNEVETELLRDENDARDALDAALGALGT